MIRRVALGGWLFVSGVLLAVVVVRVRAHDAQLTEHEQIIQELERDLSAAAELAVRFLP